MNNSWYLSYEHESDSVDISSSSHRNSTNSLSISVHHPQISSCSSNPSRNFPCICHQLHCVNVCSTLNGNPDHPLPVRYVPVEYTTLISAVYWRIVELTCVNVNESEAYWVYIWPLLPIDAHQTVVWIMEIVIVSSCASKFLTPHAFTQIE